MFAFDMAMLGLVLLAIYYQYRRNNALMIPSNTTLFGSLALPVYIAYPFATSPDSLGAIGQANHALSMQWAVDEVMIIVTVGTLCGALSYVLLPRVAPGVVSRFARREKPVRFTTSDWTIGACVSSLAGLIFVWVYFAMIGGIPMLSSDPAHARIEAAIGHSARYMYTGGFTMANVGLIFLAGGLALKKIRQYRFLSVAVAVLVSLTNLATGSRFSLLYPFVVAAAIYFSIARKKLTLTRALLLVTGFLLAAVLLQFLREVTFPSWDDVVWELLHGNTLFANLRDTGWVLMDFEAERFAFFHGKTIVAGFLGLIPSSILPFRQQYMWGALTLQVINDPDPMHPGLGHVLFGDWYVNFGYPGVVVEGAVLGVILRLWDEWLIQLRLRAARTGKYEYSRIFTLWFSSLVIGLCFSSASSPLVYPYLLGFFAILVFARVIQPVVRRARNARAVSMRQPLRWPVDPGARPMVPRNSVPEPRS